ncbi:Tat pathway signal protein [Dactylosporangium maewongense]
MITPNYQLGAARERIASPRRAGQCMSRAELADAANAALDLLYPGRDLSAHYVDFRWIGKLERGEHRWPSEERRAALRHVLGAATELQLGLFVPRRTDGRTHRKDGSGLLVPPGQPAHQPTGGDGPHRADSVIDTLDGVRDLGSVDVDTLRRQLLGAAASAAVGLLVPPIGRPQQRTIRQATADDVEAVREMLDLFSRAEQRRGGGHGRTAVTQYLHSDVADLLAAGGNDRTRRALQAAAAEVAYLTGWMGFDDSDHTAATRYLTLAAHLAHHANEPALVGHVLRALAHQALDLDQPQRALDLATASVDGARYTEASPRERALLGVVHARALAVTGNPTAAATALIRAENDLRSATAGDDEPTRVFFFTEAALAHETARTLHVLGDHTRAEEQFERSVRLRKASQFARTHAVTLGYLGAIHAETGDIEHACVTWSTALDAMAGVRSGRTRQVAARIRSTVRPWLRHMPAARDIDERAAAYLTAA